MADEPTQDASDASRATLEALHSDRLKRLMAAFEARRFRTGTRTFSYPDEEIALDTDLSPADIRAGLADLAAKGIVRPASGEGAVYHLAGSHDSL